jgi:hypothetical protein
MADPRLSSEEIVTRLQRDLERTTGDAHAALVSGVAEDVREAGLEKEGDKIVGDVQQYLHDTREHSTWPACPRHQRHPLWYRAGSWWCVEDGVAVAPLGELPAPARRS